MASAAALIDWITKALAATGLDDHSIELGSVLTLRLSHNPGIAFGLGDRLPGEVVVMLTAAVTVGVAAAALRGVWGSPLAAGLLLGGAVANLADRIVGGSVVDFLDLGWWPSFNLADAFLSVGAVLLILRSSRMQEREPAPASAAERWRSPVETSE